MWHCSYCPHTSSRKFNMHIHEQRKHPTHTQPENILVDALKKGQIKDVKVEDDPLLDIKKPAQEVPIQQNEVKKELEFLRYTPLKKYSILRLQRKERRKIILNYCRRLIKVIKELEEIELPRRIKMDWLSD